MSGERALDEERQRAGAVTHLRQRELVSDLRSIDRSR